MLYHREIFYGIPRKPSTRGVLERCNSGFEYTFHYSETVGIIGCVLWARALLEHHVIVPTQRTKDLGGFRTIHKPGCHVLPPLTA